MAILIYRISALVAAIGWFVSIYTTIVDGESVFRFLEYISGAEFQYHPMLDYWMKMAGIAFAFIGLGFLYCAVKWKETLPFGKFFALYQLICFLGVLISVLRLDLGTKIYLLDFAFFLGTGIPMLLAWYKLAPRN